MRRIPIEHARRESAEKSAVPGSERAADPRGSGRPIAGAARRPARAQAKALDALAGVDSRLDPAGQAALFRRPVDRGNGGGPSRRLRRRSSAIGPCARAWLSPRADDLVVTILLASASCSSAQRRPSPPPSGGPSSTAPAIDDPRAAAALLPSVCQLQAHEKAGGHPDGALVRELSERARRSHGRSAPTACSRVWARVARVVSARRRAGPEPIRRAVWRDQDHQARRMDSRGGRSPAIRFEAERQTRSPCSIIPTRRA